MITICIQRATLLTQAAASSPASQAARVARPKQWMTFALPFPLFICRLLVCGGYDATSSALSGAALFIRLRQRRSAMELSLSAQDRASRRQPSCWRQLDDNNWPILLLFDLEVWRSSRYSEHPG